MPHLEPLDGRTYCSIGTPDSHFGDGGLTRLSVPYAGQTKDGALMPSVMRVDANGRAVVGSMTKTGFTLRRLDAFGVADDKFAASAAGLPQAYGEQSNTSRLDVELDATNRIYLLNGLTLTRYSSSGRVDRSFGDKGRVRLKGFNRTADLDVGADGHLWVVGATGVNGYDGGQMRVVRLNADGTADGKFAQGGAFGVPVPFVEKGDFGAYAAGQVVHGFADGSVVLAGRGEYHYRDQDPGSEAVLDYHAIQSVRLDSRGRLVKSYGHRGIVTASYIYNDAVISSDPEAVGIRSDGTVFVGNRFSTDNPDPDNAGGRNLRIIAPSGATDFLTSPGIDTLVHGEFIDAPIGGSYFVNSEGLWQLTADGTPYTPFNSGKRLAAITAAAVGNNGELLTAETGRDAYDKSYNVSRYFVTSGPAATFVLAVLTKAAKVVSFNVSYDDPDGVNISTLNNRDLVVTGNDYGGVAALAGKTRDSATGRVTARYEIAYSTAGFPLKNGLYTVSLTGSRLGVTDNNGNRATARAIGTVVINVA